jgi:hypothetical protein
MAADKEPDLAGLFAPVDIADAVQGVLEEARAALGHIDDPVDAELWGSDVIGALSAAGSSAGETEAMTAIATTLVPAAERAPSPEALAMLRIFSVIGSADLRETAPRRRFGWPGEMSPTRRGPNNSAHRGCAPAGTTPTWAAARNR